MGKFLLIPQDYTISPEKQVGPFAVQIDKKSLARCRRGEAPVEPDDVLGKKTNGGGGIIATPAKNILRSA